MTATGPGRTPGNGTAFPPGFDKLARLAGERSDLAAVDRFAGVLSRVETAGRRAAGGGIAAGEAAVGEPGTAAAGAAGEGALREAARGIEAVFLQELIGRLRRTVPEGGLFEKSFAREVYEGMFDEHLAAAMAAAGGIGLADLLYQQLRPYLDEKA